MRKRRAVSGELQAASFKPCEKNPEGQWDGDSIWIAPDEIGGMGDHELTIRTDVIIMNGKSRRDSILIASDEIGGNKITDT